MISPPRCHAWRVLAQYCDSHARRGLPRQRVQSAENQIAYILKYSALALFYYHNLSVYQFLKTIDKSLR